MERMAWFRTGYGKLVLSIACLLALSTAGFFLLESRDKGVHGVFGALWWTVVTLTTVGYGDMVPASAPGKVLGLLVMVSGIGLVSTLTGNLASMLVERKARKRKGLLAVNLSDHVVILGWNSHAPGLVDMLIKTGVLSRAGLVLVSNLEAGDREEVMARLGLGSRLHFIHGTISRESVVAKAKPETARVVYILSMEGVDPKLADQESIYAALTLQSLAPKVPVYGEVTLPENREHMQRAGVNEIIVRGELAGSILGMIGADPSMWTFLREMLGLSGKGLLSIRAIREDEKGLTWAELDGRERQKSGTLPLALCRTGKFLTLDDVLDQGSALDQFVLELFSATGQSTDMGRQDRQVLVNPPPDEAVRGFDAILYLGPGSGP